MISNKLRPYLDDLSDRIVPDQEKENFNVWVDFTEGRCETDIFYPPLRNPAPPKIEWPEININDAIEDPESMLLAEFKLVSDTLSSGQANRLNVRCNYGTGILPTLFGCDLYMMARELNTLPTALPLHSAEKIKAILSAGIPDLRTGLGAKVFDTTEMFLEVFEEYPAIKAAVELYHPDLQGPIDVAEIVWGSEIFLAFYDQPAMLREFLELMTETYLAFLRKWYNLAPTSDSTYSCHWGMLIKGKPTLRNDSLMNLSPEAYVDFIRPLDQRILDEFGNGIIHFCGRGDHFIEPMSEMKGLTGIAMSQPEYNDMEKIYLNTVDKGIPLLGLHRETAEAALQAGRKLHGWVQCWPKEQSETKMGGL